MTETVERHANGMLRRGNDWIPDDPRNVDRQTIASLIAAALIELVDVQAPAQPRSPGDPRLVIADLAAAVKHLAAATGKPLPIDLDAKLTKLAQPDSVDIEVDPMPMDGGRP